MLGVLIGPALAKSDQRAAISPSCISFHVKHVRDVAIHQPEQEDRHQIRRTNVPLHMAVLLQMREAGVQNVLIRPFQESANFLDQHV